MGLRFFKCELNLCGLLIISHLMNVVWLEHTWSISIPLCMGKSTAFYSKHGRKGSFIDCHRKFLPKGHQFLRDIKSFLKVRVKNSTPPHYSLLTCAIMDCLEEQTILKRVITTEIVFDSMFVP